jgi:hypothetical protein
MPEFIPVLIAAVLMMVVLLIVFSGGIETFTAPSDISNSRTLVLAEDISISHNVGETVVSNFDTTVSNGAFSREDKKFYFNVPTSSDVSEGILRFDVSDTNLYGNLLFFVNGKLIYNEPTEIGSHVLTFGGDVFNQENQLDIKAESSGWRMWAPTIYKLNGNISTNYLGERSERIKFNVTELEILNLDRFELRIFGSRTGSGRLIARINGYEVYRGYLISSVTQSIQSDILEEGENTLELSSEIDSKYDLSSVQIVLFFG